MVHLLKFDACYDCSVQMSTNCHSGRPHTRLLGCLLCLACTWRPISCKIATTTAPRWRAAMAELKLFAFGPPRLERDGGPIDLPVRRTLALLIYLAMTAQPQSRDTLATLLWPESSQRTAR